ncbi:MAG: gamma-glutamyltransferase, partial [Thiohalocapsa sp.]
MSVLPRKDDPIAVIRHLKAPPWSLFSRHFSQWPRRLPLILVVCVSTLAATVVRAAPAQEPEKPPASAIASAHPAATVAGVEILASGGNAFDAAVAVSAVLAVVEPYSSGVGGGGFWLLHVADQGRDLMIDGRERAPLAATRDMYLDENGEFVPERSLNGPLAAGIPGEPAALVHLAERYGRLPLGLSLTPAITLARDGFAVDALYRRLATWRLAALQASPAAAAQFLIQGQVPEEGAVIRQPDLADTLARLAEHGRDGFYAGPVAKALVQGVRAAGGIWTLEDLAGYRVVERQPIVGEYRGWRIVSAAPPSSGGVALVQMLNMLSRFDLGGMAGPDRIHVTVEAMRRAYRDRALYLGDPDHVDV